MEPAQQEPSKKPTRGGTTAPRPQPPFSSPSPRPHAVSFESQPSAMPDRGVAPPLLGRSATTFSYVHTDDGSGPSTRGRRKNNNGFSLRFPAALSRISNTAALKSQASQHIVYPPMPLRSMTDGPDGEIVVISKAQANREIQAYEDKCLERCRDKDLPRRERLLNLGRVLYCILNFPKINLAARYVTAFLVAAILLNAALVIMGSMPEFQYHPAACLEPLCTPDQPGALCTQVVCAPVEKDEIVYMNVALVLVFTLEYLTRLCTAHTVSAAVLLARRVAIDLQGNLIDTSAIIQWGPWRKTWEYASSFMGLVDLASALPFFIALFAIRPIFNLGISNSHTLSLMHLCRAVRTLKLARYSRQSALFLRTLQASYPALRFYFVMSFLTMLLVAALVFFFEKGEYRVTAESPMGAFYRHAPTGHHLEISPFDSIVTTLYWAIINTTSLKSAYPLSSPVSRVLSVLLAYLGVILLALPLSIVGRHFQHQYDLLNMGDEQSPEETAAFLPEPGQPTTAPPSVQRRGID